MIEMSDAIHAISADGNATLFDFASYNTTVIGLNATSPISTVIYVPVTGGGSVAITLKDGRVITLGVKPDGTFTVTSSNFFSDEEFQTVRYISQVVFGFATNNGLTTLTDTFAA